MKGDQSLFTVDDLVRRWRKVGMTAQQVRILHRSGVLKASPLRKRPLVFHITAVENAEKGTL